MKTKLTKEQSKRLIELGVPERMVSELREWEDDLSKWIHRGDPIFTLTDLLGLLPKEIFDDETDWLMELSMFYSISTQKWCVGYYAIEDKNRGVQFVRISTELIDALYELLCWVIENNYLKFD